MKSPQWKSLGAVVSLLALLVSSQSARATSATWDGTASGLWNATGSWGTGTGPIPGATSPSTNNMDTATFGGSSGTPIVTVDTYRNIQNITFNTTGTKYTLSSGTLYLTSGGTVQTLGSAAQTINSAILLEGGYSFLNSTSSGSTLTFGGSISGDSGVGALTLSLGGNSSSTSLNTISGVISDGTSDTLSVTKSGTGTWVLTNTDTYSGATTVNAGILTLSGTGQLTNSAVTLNTNTTLAIADSATSGTVTRAGSVTAAGGLITVTGSSANSNDTITTLTLNPGYLTQPTIKLAASSATSFGVGGGDNVIVAVPGSANTLLTIGTLARNQGGTVEFTTDSSTVALGTDSIASATAGQVNIAITNTPTLIGGGGAISSDTTSIIPFATGAALASTTAANTPTDFVTYTSANGIQLLTNYLTNGLSGISGTTTTDNAKVTSDSITANTTINSLVVGGGLTLNSHTLAVTSGALLFTDGNSYTITAGTLQLGTGGEAFIDQGGVRTDTINAAITGPTAGLTITLGDVNNVAGTIIFAGANNYTGGTIITGGGGTGGGATLQIGSGSTTGQIDGNNGTVALYDANLSFDLTSNYSFSGAISTPGTSSPVPSGNLTLIAGNTGTITLGGASTYSGVTTIDRGTLSVSSVANGGSASNIGSSSNAASNLILGAGNTYETTNTGTLKYTGGAVNTDRLFTIGANGGTIDSSGSGPVDFTNTGNNVSALGTALVTYTNLSTTVTISAGGPPASSLIVGSVFTSAATGIPANDTIASVGSTTFTLQTAANVTQSTAVVGSYAFNRTLTLTGTNTGANTISGVLADDSAGGMLAVTKTNIGTWVLAGANTYSGGTTVSKGALYVNDGGGASYSAPSSSASPRPITATNSTGSGTGTGAVTVGNGTANSGTLAGSGTIAPTGGAGVTINNGGTLASGGLPSTMTATAAGPGLTLNNTEASSSLLTVNGGATLTFDLASTVNGAGSGGNAFTNPNTDSTYLSLAGNTTDQIFSNTTTADNIDLVDLTVGSPTVTLTLRYQNPYLLIQTALGDNSDFANLVTTGGTGVNGYVLGISNGTGGYTAFNIEMFNTSNVQINSPTNYGGLRLYLENGDLEVIPEPGTWALMLGGLAVLVFIQSRRRMRVE